MKKPTIITMSELYQYAWATIYLLKPYSIFSLLSIETKIIKKINHLKKIFEHKRRCFTHKLLLLLLWLNKLIIIVFIR